MFDIIFFGVLLYYMWRGYKRGFAREIPRIASLVSAIIIGIIFYSVVAMMLNATPLPDAIGSLTSDEFMEKVAGKDIAESLEESADEQVEETAAPEDETVDEEVVEDEAVADEAETAAEDENADVDKADVKDADDNTGTKTKSDAEKRKEMQKNMNVVDDNEENSVNQIFGAINSVEDKKGMVGEIIVMYISLILIFFISYYIIRYITKKKKLYRKIKIPMQINPALGGVIGIVKGLLVIYIAVAFLVVCEPLIPSSFITDQIAHSEIIKAMYDKNYIANIVARQDFLSGGI